MDTLLPVAVTLGFGGLLGYCTGVFLKRTVRLLGCLLGLAFIAMQLLAYYGYAEWHWDAIARHTTPAAQAAGHFLWKLIHYNMPFTGGFAAGFFLAVRR